jgi:UDP-2-acetamido-3-amino-2,3-dideoxy-glucuronate N-acetyltransferase
MKTLLHRFRYWLNGCYIHKSVIIWKYVNLYGCNISANTTIGSYTEIGGPGTSIGRSCTIGARVYMPPGIIIKDNVFIGPGTIFTNDTYPKAHNRDFKLKVTTIDSGVSIGAGCIILPGITIGRNSMIGAGTVVTKDVPPNTLIHERKQYEKNKII